MAATNEYVTLEDIINQFMIVYVGEGKTISKVNRIDATFHAQRALQELSYDTLKSISSKECEVPASLKVPLPPDYINYTKISWVDSAGIKHPIYPTSKTSNPTRYQTDSNGDYLLGDNEEYIPSGELIVNGDFQDREHGWGINMEEQTPGTITSYQETLDGGLPLTGWFIGFDGNAVRGYQIPQNVGIKQTGIPIINGQDYKISIDASGYTSGRFAVILVDEQGISTDAGNITGNGTFTATVTAGDGSSGYVASQLFIYNEHPTQNGDVILDNISVVKVGDESESKTWDNYKNNTPSENNNDDYEDDVFWPIHGERYGLDPQHAQVNGSFYIDYRKGNLHLSSNLSGKTIIIDYINDGLDYPEGASETEFSWSATGVHLGSGINTPIVHKFAEEAIYKWIMYAILSTRANTPEHIVRRYKKERFAAIRQAKLRLSNIKLEELSRILRGKSKQIKH
tara:strand:+ start:1722 stop:3086 length:1365 start_codon:yes stop_codon:yes gene_type:complete